MSDLLARLIADGTSAELVAEVAMLLAEKKLAQEAIEDRRAKDRERQNRRRSRDVTECHVTERDSVTDPALSRPPNENNSNPPTHTHPDNNTRARKGADFPMLDCTDPDTWGDFLRNRKAKKLPNTASAHRKLVADLADIAARTGWPPGQVFAACVAKGWGAIYDPRDKNDERTTRHTAQHGGNLAAPSGRPMGRTEAAARAAAGMVGSGKSGGDHAGPSALPDHRRAIGYVSG